MNISEALAFVSSIQWDQVFCPTKVYEMTAPDGRTVTCDHPTAKKLKEAGWSNSPSMPAIRIHWPGKKSSTPGTEKPLMYVIPLAFTSVEDVMGKITHDE